MQCYTVAGADSPRSKQFRAAGGQGKQHSAREVSRHPGELFNSLQSLFLLVRVIKSTHTAAQANKYNV